MMSFWAGFLIGFFAAYVLSIGVMVCIAVSQHLAKRRERRARRDREFVDREFLQFQELPSPPDPDQTVHFTHLTGLGNYVRGRDD